jgi:hypothetical protein
MRSVRQLNQSVETKRRHAEREREERGKTFKCGGLLEALILNVGLLDIGVPLDMTHLG